MIIGAPEEAFPECREGKSCIVVVGKGYGDRELTQLFGGTFTGPLPMVLSGLESADKIDTKDVRAVPI